MRNVHSVYPFLSPVSEADGSEASSVSEVTEESVERSKQTAKISHQIASMEQQVRTNKQTHTHSFPMILISSTTTQIAAKKEEVMRWRDMDNMDKAIETMREVRSHTRTVSSLLL